MTKFLVALLLLPIHAFALFNGDFSGKGQAISHPQEKVRSCSQIFLSITQDKNTLHVLQGGYNCQEMDASYPDFSLTTKNGKLISDNTVVGTYTDTEIDLYKQDKQEAYTFHLHLKIDGHQVSYQEDWTDEGKPALTVKGLLWTK